MLLLQLLNQVTQTYFIAISLLTNIFHIHCQNSIHLKLYDPKWTHFGLEFLPKLLMNPCFVLSTSLRTSGSSKFGDYLLSKHLRTSIGGVLVHKRTDKCIVLPTPYKHLQQVISHQAISNQQIYFPPHVLLAQ